MTQRAPLVKKGRYTGRLAHFQFLRLVLVCLRPIKLTLKKSSFSARSKRAKTSPAVGRSFVPDQVQRVRVRSWANFESCYTFLERKRPVVAHLWNTLFLPLFSGFLHFSHGGFSTLIVLSSRSRQQRALSGLSWDQFQLMAAHLIGR